MKIAVYCGSTPGNDPLYTEMAYDLGRWMGQNGHELVYGGSSTGLMGAVADGVLSEDGQVTGVIPNVKLIMGRRHPRLTTVIQTESMAERKTVMLEMADAFIALPGGIGTLDEITEIISLKSLGIVQGPIIFYSMNGYYESTRAALDNILAHGFGKADYFQDIVFAEDLTQIEKALS